MIKRAYLTDQRRRGRMSNFAIHEAKVQILVDISTNICTFFYFPKKRLPKAVVRDKSKANFLTSLCDEIHSNLVKEQFHYVFDYNIAGIAFRFILLTGS